MIGKLSELPVVAFTKFAKQSEMTICGYCVPKTYCSQHNQVAITSS